MRVKHLAFAFLAVIGLLAGFSVNSFAGDGVPTTPGGTFNGKIANDYQGGPGMRLGSDLYRYNGSPNDAPVYIVGGAVPEGRAYGTSIESFGFNGAAVAGAQPVAPVASRPLFGGRLLGRLAARRTNPYEGINPYAGNVFDGNTVTRGPRDFLMSNPPSIGP